MLMDEANKAANELENAVTAVDFSKSLAGTLQYELVRRLAENWLPEAWRDTHVVLAVSGGADSVAMLRAMTAIKACYGGTGRLYVAHLNHGLRGAEAEADEAWLATLCDRLGVPLETSKADVKSLATEQGDGWEAAARSARYDFLRRTAESIGARFVATAHTADDQVETVLQRIVRGTGLAGLAGIPRYRPLSNSVTLVRPMLPMWRREIVAYLNELGQEWRLDSSNQDPHYTRNRLRLELLPLIRERFNDAVDEALSRLATQADEAQRVIETLAADIATTCVAVEHVHDRDDRPALRTHIECSRLASLPQIVVREVCKVAWRGANLPLQAMGFSEWQLLADMAAGNCLQTVANLPANIRVCRQGQLLIFESLGLP